MCRTLRDDPFVDPDKKDPGLLTMAKLGEAGGRARRAREKALARRKTEGHARRAVAGQVENKMMARVPAGRPVSCSCGTRASAAGSARRSAASSADGGASSGRARPARLRLRGARVREFDPAWDSQHLSAPPAPGRGRLCDSPNCCGPNRTGPRGASPRASAALVTRNPRHPPWATSREVTPSQGNRIHGRGYTTRPQPKVSRAQAEKLPPQNVIAFSSQGGQIQWWCNRTSVGRAFPRAR